MQVVLLVDFDNYFKKEIDDYSENELNYHIIRLIDLVLVKKPDVDKISLRLYSGWHEEDHLSKKASLTMQLFSKINIFPIVLTNKRKLIHGQIEFATELLQIPNFTWFYTFKEKPGIPHLRINRNNSSEVCEKSKEHCPVYLLSNFTKSKSKYCKVPDCMNRQKDVFFSREQKMVDTLIACDIISLYEDPEIDSFFLISDDMDHLPALAYGSVKNNSSSKVHICIRNKSLAPIYNSIISNFGIELILMP